VYVNQTNLKVKFSTKKGTSRVTAKNVVGSDGPPRPPLEPSLGNTRTKHKQLLEIILNFSYDAKKLLQADDCIMITSN